MSEAERWQENNARQLGAALAHLRQRLERYIQQQGGPAPPDAIVTPPSAAPSLPGDNRDAMPEEGAVPNETLPSALTVLSERLNLSRFDEQVLLLCAAMELDTRIPSLCARAHDDPQKPFPTFALALALFDDPTWDVISPERPLRYWRLIEINQSAAQPLTTSALRVDERVVAFLKGLNSIDDRLTPFLAPLEVEEGSQEISASQSAVGDRLLQQWRHAAESGRLPAAQLLGSDALSKQLVAHYAAAKLKRHLYRLPADLLPTPPSDLETLARLWQRESRLLPVALYLDAEEWEASAAGRSENLSRFLARDDGLCFVASREALARIGRAHIAFDITKPTRDEQLAAWTEAIGADAAESPAALAAQFNLNLPTLRRLAQRAREDSKDAPARLGDKLWEVCRESERPRLDALAQRLEPKMQWTDLVLPQAEMKLLHEIADQVGQRNRVYNDWGFVRKMNRGFGISVLFAGQSGCGKTMAAEVIARELRLNLYRIDLSAVVNKYIGETEKNLRRLFDAAEEGGSILFFDEADALFGKRSEVKDSHDRYANIEINYLLQRLESYRGLAILATNMKSALDPAFVRRLRFIIDFPFPGAAERKRLWEKVFLQDDIRNNAKEDVSEKLPVPPLGVLDYDRLARVNLTGGDIHNAALNACFMAANMPEPKVTMPFVLSAARAEFLKLGRPVNEADFRWNEPVPELSATKSKDEVLAPA
jgi:DNA polymerase III delta prime subunit